VRKPKNGGIPKMIILEKFNSQSELFQEKALRFSEKYGILGYKIDTHKMVWEKYYPTEGRFQYEVDLNTMKEKAYQI
jgi:hypothetical protein